MIFTDKLQVFSILDSVTNRKATADDEREKVFFGFFFLIKITSLADCMGSEEE